MSLDSFRSSAEAAKHHELCNSEISRKRKLRELYTITSYINASQPPTFSFDSPPDARELQFLDENDISKGRYFREDTLPVADPIAKPSHPLPEIQAAESAAPRSVAKASATNVVAHDVDARRESPAHPASPAVRASPSIGQDPSKQPTPAPSPSPPSPQEDLKPASASRAAEDENASAPSASTPEPSAPAPDQSQPAAVDPGPQAPPDRPSVDPKRASATLSDDVTLPSPETMERPAKRPRTIHLPPKEVQEQRLRDIHHAQERAAQRERKEDEQLAVTGETVNGEVASSPSSTLGPQSANTSRADQHSPATSPDEETPRRGVSFPDSHQQIPETEKDGVSGMTPEEMVRSVTDRAAKKRGANNTTADAQLRFEEEQAVRHARDSIKETDPVIPKVKNSDLTEEDSKAIQESRVAEDGVDDFAMANEGAYMGLQPQAAINGHPSETPLNNITQDAPSARGNENNLAKQNTTTAEKDSAPDAPTEEVNVQKVADAQIESLERRERPDESQLATRSSDAVPGASPITPKSAPPSDGLRTTSTFLRVRDAEYRDKDKTKAAGVVFAKQDSALTLRNGQAMNKAWTELKGASQDPDKDYLIGMFDFQAHSGPLYSCRELLERATKTYTTASKYASIREQQDYKILKRIYTLQHANRWSLRQMEKSTEPPRQVTFHDSLLSQMKWMRTDFREERRWRMAAARNMADACAEWVAASPEKRKSLQVKATRKTAAPPAPADPMEEDIPSPPELISSGANETESESFPEDEELPPNLRHVYPPAALFSLGYGDVVAKIDNTPVSERVLLELPSYESRLKGFPSPSVLGPVSNEADIIAVSHLVNTKLVPKSTEPPRKRSRYEYEDEDDMAGYANRRPTSERSNASTPSLRFSRNGLPPEQMDVALFLPENKHVRDRLHAGHAFRPPSEFPMPSTAFFESRAPSQWLWDEDQRLRALVKEYQFNWSLVAASLGQASVFTSGAERRTPWECFERWVQLEGLPGEMAKTPYFRTYQARLEAAQRTVTAQYQAAQQQAQQQQGQAPGQILGTPRRRTAQPIRVERRKNNRFLALIDAMRKQARKRETAAHKQQEAAKAAALRKAHEAAPVRNSVHTPQEFSKLKYDRDQKMLEKQEEYRRQMLAAQRQAMQRPGQMPGQHGIPNGLTQQRNGTPNNAHGQANIGAGASQNGQLHPNMNMQGRPHPAQGMQGNMPNGNMPALPMGMPQAQMQINMQGQRLQPHQAPDMRMAMQQRNLNNLTQQQQFALQQQQQMNRANSMSGVHMGGANNAMQSPAMVAAGMGAPKVNGANNTGMNGMQGSSASPRMTANHATPQPQALSSGHVPQITNLTHEIQLQHPNMSQTEASRIASERMSAKMAANARQNALNAAAGATAAGTATNATHLTPSPYQQHAALATGGSTSPSNQQAAYQQQMRQQMLQQRPGQQNQAGSPNMGSARPESRSSTPQNAIIQQQGSPPRPPSQQQQQGPTQPGSR